MKRWIWFVFLLSIQSTWAHGDFHDQIVQLSKEIAESPDSAYLHFKKGKLLFYHEDYKACLQSLKKARKKGYRDILQTLFFSKAYLELGHFNKAGQYAQSVIDGNPEHVTAHRLLARIRYKQKRFEAAGETYELANQHAIRLVPENVIETAKAWEAMKTSQGNQRAISTIENGIEKLGEIISLQIYLKRLLINNGGVDQAISIQKRIIAQSARKEKAWFELAKLYQQTGAVALNEYALLQAQDAFSLLPKRIQHTPAMVELKKLITRDLQNTQLMSQ